MAKKEKNKKSREDKKDYYVEGVGRRKTATARVRIYPNKTGKKQKQEFIVNEDDLEDYFPLGKQVKQAKSPFDVVDENFSTEVLVEGSGLNSQAEAVRHGLSRALVEFNEEFKQMIKPHGYLTRDSRMKERKKPGFRSARRPQQWKKR